MVLRRLAALVIFGIGAFLLYRVVDAASAYSARGGDFAGYLFEPPSGILQLAGSALMVVGGLLGALRIKGGAITGLVGSLIIAALGALLLSSTSDIQVGLDEALYAMAGILLSFLILTLRRV